MFKVLKWSWRLVSEADTAHTVWTGLTAVAGTVVGVVSWWVGELPWPNALLLGAVVALILLAFVWLVFSLIIKSRDVFTGRANRPPHWLSRNANEQLGDFNNLVQFDSGLGDVNLNLDKADPHISLIVTVRNETIFDINVDTFSGGISYQGDLLTTPPNLIMSNPRIAHNSRTSFHLFQPVTPGFKENLRGVSADDVANNLSISAGVQFSVTGVNGEETTRTLSIPQQYFNKTN